MGNFRIHIFTKTDTNKIFQKDIYENGKAIYLTTLRKHIFEKWFRIFEIKLFENYPLYGTNSA